MRHKYKRTLQLEQGPQKALNVMRTMLTNLVRDGKMVTTKKKARTLISYANKFFARVVETSSKFEGKNADRELKRLIESRISTKKEGKKVVETWLPRFKELGSTSGFVANYKLGFRPGDGSEKHLVKIV